MSKVVAFMLRRTIATDIFQGIVAGGVLAYFTATSIIGAEVKAITTGANGWNTTLQCNLPGNGILLRAACASILPGAAVAQEAAYWTTTVDGNGQRLNGRHDYILHFPAAGLPPNNAFWSLTMTEGKGYMVSNPANRYRVSDRSGLAPNADGSIDVYFQRTAPAGHESNWLPTPAGDFKLWMRAYLPGAAILNGEYRVPPVVRVKR